MTGTLASPSSSRADRFVRWAVLFALFVGPYGELSHAGELEDRLDTILRDASVGIVRIDVRRPWNSYRSDSLPQKTGSLAVHRIQGSGVVWDEDGYVLTVADLAQPGDTLEIRGADGSLVRGEYVGQDSDLGLSLIRVDDPRSLRPIERARPTPLGERGWILTLGYHAAGAIHLTVSRVLGQARRSGMWRARIDADVDPGLAGGGVLDEDGNLIGLLLGEGSESLLLADGRKRGLVEYCMGSRGPTDEGWVVPIDLIAGPIDSIRAERKGQEGFLGVRARLPEEGRESTEGAGVSIAEVVPGSPADRSGVRPGDRLISFNGVSLTSWAILTERVTETKPGSKIRIDLLRGGEATTVEVGLADRAHAIWREKQRMLAGGRERMLRRQIQGLQQELEFLRHQLAYYR